LFARSREGVAGDGQLQSLRANESGLARPHNGAHAGEPASSLSGERAALRAFFDAKFAATRRSTPSRDLAAALRALSDAQHAAMQELTRRRHAFKTSLRERRRAQTSGRREGERRARPS
jgi:hypothetical protein